MRKLDDLERRARARARLLAALDLPDAAARNRIATLLLEGADVRDGETLIEGLARVLGSHAEDVGSLREAIAECVALLARTLRPHYAVALEVVDVEGKRVREYADEAGISANNAGVRLHRARLAMRKRLAEALRAED